MLLNLSDIIEIPGGIAEFECGLSVDNLPGIAGFIESPKAVGQVRNRAGALILDAVITAGMRCICARCGCEFANEKKQTVSVPVAEDLSDDENPDIFPLTGDYLNVAEILETLFILDLDTKLLCKPECKGLCHSCGANLNEGPCPCPAESDPRLAVLEQLLDIEDVSE